MANPGTTSLPTEQVRTMRAQGMDNNQIIQALQKDGFSSMDIFDAMNQADMNPGSPQTPGGPDQFPVSSNIPEPDFPGPGSMAMDSSAPKRDLRGMDVSTEELVEAIIDEKWNEMVKDLEKVVEWKNTTNAKILQLDQKFNDLKAEFDKLHTALISKIDDYDKNIMNVGAEVRAMEKVFSKVLPVFTENVSELSKISKDMKKSSKK